MLAERKDPSLAPPPAPPARLGPGLLRDGDPAAGLFSIQARVTARSKIQPPLTAGWVSTRSSFRW